MKRFFSASGDSLKRQTEWMEMYGTTFRYRGFLSSYRLFTADTRALTYVMTHTDIFPKPDSIRKGLANVVGDGLLSAEGDVHKRERRIMGPSFGPAQIRELVPIFWDKGNKLRDIWLNILKESPDGTINVLSWLSRATLDIIGVAGFDHHFNSLEGVDEDELSVAFKQVFQASQSPGVLEMLQNIIPVLNYIPTQRRKGVVTSLTTTATTWALYALAKHPHVQRKLRVELLESGLGDEPGMADLDKLPYLDHFVRECLRVHSPVPNVAREAAQDAQIPVSKIYKDKYGVERDHISVQKGDMIRIPILTLHNMKEIWGEDAGEFKPERWGNLPEAVKEMPGVWGHLMTFIHGQRSCIGFRFSIIEMKALLYTLVRSIEFSMDPSITIGITATAVTRPHVVSEREKGNQMPLICKPVSGI
ncbi:hypothetical protein FRC11_013005 [Ceratobasidium sp. 423]|nr:hypothetical protein FRC11_013005 [Ceratobasidium sp. 423]